MTITRLAMRGLAYHRRTYAAVAFGVATGVAVMAGALLVGSSVRASLAALAAARLGRADVVVFSERPFSETLSQRLATSGLSAGSTAAPLLTLMGTTRHEASGRHAGRVQVYGIDERFFAFHGVTADSPTGGTMLLSPDLAAELGAVTGDVVVLRVQRLTDIPADSLLGGKEDIGRSIRLRVLATLSRENMGEFSLTPTQGPIRAAFVPLARLQRDLDLPGRANAVLLSNPRLTATAAQATLAGTVTARDLDLNISVLPGDAAPVKRGPVPAPPLTPPAISVEASSGLLADASVTALTEIGGRESLTVTPVLTWLANRMTIGDRMIPYSLVTAIGAEAAGDTRLASLLRDTAGGPDPPIVLNDWAAKDAHVTVGESLDLEYYRWADEGALKTEHATFRVAGVIPMSGLGLDRRLAPTYPGITDADNVSDWSPPFPIDLKLVRPQDNEYWKQFRTTPKAFVPLDVGQRLWRTRYGQATSLRLTTTTPAVDIEAVATRVRDAAARAIDPLRTGFSVVDVARQSTSAARGATDFGEYFSYFSFFLVVSALLLTSLLFRLGIEQRLGEIGVLRATGFSLAAVRRIWMTEGVVVVIAGAIAGVGLAIGWASLMMYGLRTWWVGAVGTTQLRLHVDVIALVAGAMGAGVAAAIAIVLTIRGLSQHTPRALLTGSREPRSARQSHRTPRLAWLFGIAALALTGLSAARVMPAAGAFFGAGALVLAAGLTAFGWWLRRPSSNASAPQTTSVVQLGLRNASWRPGRSLTSAGLVAAAVFLLVAVNAFRKGADSDHGRESGTGGFALIAESALPIVHDPGTDEGRLSLGVQTTANDPEFAGVNIMAARLRPGDDASCLNLYVPARPRIVGVPAQLIETAPFSFTKTLAAASTDEAVRANPWRLLGDADKDGIVPAIAAATSLEYVLHASVGDVITIDQDTARPVRLRIVAALGDSVLQGELLIGNRAFTSLFPEAAGYRVFLVSISPAPAERVDRVSRILEERLDPFGLDVEDSVRRLASYHRVENTYLSTFQALGALGLVLGCFGLGAITARNVLERRRELALLGAAGYSARDLRTLVISEQLSLVAVGLLVGVVAAAVAVAPAVSGRGGGPANLLAIVWLAVVAAAGLLSALAATRQMRRLPLVASLRSG